MIRDVLGNRLKAFLILLGLGLLLVALFFFGMVLTVIRDRVMDTPIGEWGYRYVQIAATMLVNGLVFATLYKVLPRPSVHWLHALGGGAFVTLVWELGRLVLAYIIVRSNYGAYGVIGAFMAMMVWVYYASTLLFLGRKWCKCLDTSAMECLATHRPVKPRRIHPHRKRDLTHPSFRCTRHIRHVR